MAGGHRGRPGFPRKLSRTTAGRALARVAASLGLLLAAGVAESQPRKIGEMELRLAGLTASLETIDPVVPKHTNGGVRVVVRAGNTVVAPADLSRFLGSDFRVEGDLSGPGFVQPIPLPVVPPEPSDDPLVLRTPPAPIAGMYRLDNLRIVAGGRIVLDVEPSSVALKVIDQILVTQVTTRALTLDEIRGKGIVLDSDDYLGFEFTMGFKLDSKAVDLTFPVVFDRQGVAIPQPLSPPAAPSRQGMQLPTILPLLMEAEGPGGEREELKFKTPGGVEKPITIPAVLVIPGNIGFLKQFFSAQLYVSNGAPVGSNLDVESIKATMKLPPGADLTLDTADDPLALPTIERDGRVFPQPLTMEVRGLGADGESGTADDVNRLAPGQQAQAEFLLRGEKEGFHQVGFDLEAQLLGLPIGPVTVKGKATGGVLVRNASFNVTFTVPSVVRAQEKFTVRATVTNIGKSPGNDVSVQFNAAAMSGATLLNAPAAIPTILPGGSAVLEFKFRAEVTGKVTAAYLNMDTSGGSSGRLNFALGVGERGVPLSPDTLVLPTDISVLPEGVVDAAMRVLGQAWSVANAPPGSLPTHVIRSSPQVVVMKALALAESALRVNLGQSSDAAVRDLLYDFFSGSPLDPGFDQLLRTTEAGHAFVRAVGAELGDAATLKGGGPEYEFDTARVIASAAPFMSLGWDGVPGDLGLVDGSGLTSVRNTNLTAEVDPRSHNVVGATLTPLGFDRMLGIVTRPTATPYVWEFRAAEPGSGRLSLTTPRPDGTFGRATWSTPVDAGTIVRIVASVDGEVTVQKDLEGDGAFEYADTLSVHSLPSDGPQLLSAAIIGPETLSGASPFGFQTALVFDRVVSETDSALVSNYLVPKNTVRSAKRQLSGRLVFASLSLPEGPYLPGQVTVRGLRDNRGVEGPELTRPLVSRLDYAPPGSDPSSEMGAIVSGRVLNGDGEPLSGREVVYSQYDGLCGGDAPERGLAAVTTDSRGAFELRYVRREPCGRPFGLTTTDPRSGAQRKQWLTVRAAREEIVADFVMLAAGAVEGTILQLDGSPAAGAKVRVQSVTEPQVGAATLADALGRYSVTGITVGPVVVRAGKGNGVGTATGRIDKASVPAVVDVTIDGGAVKIRGTVRTSDGGVVSPASGAIVTYYLMSGVFGQPLATIATDARGEYAFTGLPVGGFQIRAQVNSRDAATIQGTAVAGDDLSRDITVEIPPVTSFGFIEGSVRMPDGSPAAAVVVSVGPASVLTEADGTYAIPVVPQLTAHPVNATTRDRKRTGRATAIVNQPGHVASGVVITLSGLGRADVTVVDPLGQPLPGQTVRLLDSQSDPCGGTSSTTDALGRARFSDLGLGSAVAQVIYQGAFKEAARTTLSITGDDETAFGILRVETRSSSIEGVVTDPAGAPVQGADVQLRSLTFVSDTFRFVCGMQTEITHTTRTGSDGRFRFVGIRPGRVTLTASQAFFPVPASAVVDLLAEQTSTVPLKLTTTISGRISGVVYEPDGVTPAGAGVEVTMAGQLPDVTVVTDAAGRYEFAKIFPAGVYALTARDTVTGFVERATIYVAPIVDATHDIRLKGKARVRVSVTDALAQPVAQAYVTVRESNYPGRTFEGAISAANQGVIEFPGVFEGPVTIEARDMFGRGGRSSLNVPIGAAQADAVVRLATTGTVRGRFVKPDATPIPFGTVKLIVGGRVIGQVTTSSDQPAGEFEFAYVPAGSFRLEALDPLSGRSGIATGTIDEEGETVDVTLAAQSVGAVRGVVTSNGVPAPGARVELRSGSYTASTVADAAGSYLVNGVPEGLVVVSADTGNGALRATGSGNLIGEGTTLVLDVALRGTGSISGQVFKAGGTVPAGITSVSLYVGGVGGDSITGFTDDEGGFYFDRVPVGAAQIEVDSLGSDDFATGSFAVEIGEETEAVLVLNGIGGLRGRGLDSQGQPVVGRVTIELGPAQRRRGYPLDLASDGTFELPGVLAGPFTATLSVRNGGVSLYGTSTGQILDAQVTETVVQLQDSATIVGRVMRGDGVTPAYGTMVTLTTSTYVSSTRNAQPDGTFSFPGVPLSSIALEARDALTNGVVRTTGVLTTNGEVLDVGTLVLDETPISVVSITPANGSVDVPVTQSVVVTFSDPVGTYPVNVRHNGVNIASLNLLSEDRRTVTVPPPGGKWPNPTELMVLVDTRVTDSFGRPLAQTVSSVFSTIDGSGPVPLALTPANGSYSNPVDTPLTVTFDEPLVNDEAELFEVLRLLRWPDGSVVPGSVARTGPNSLRFIPAVALASDSSYVLNAPAPSARDARGNTQTVSATSVFSTTDTLPPVLSLSPAPESATTDPTPTISVTINDALRGTTGAPAGMTLDGLPITGFTRTEFILQHTPSTDLAEGRHEITAFVEDLAGNRATIAGGFFVDRAAPAPAEITSGVSAGSSVAGTVSLSASSFDATSGVARIEILEGASVRATLLPPSFTVAYNTATLSEGSHVFVARAVDKAGNVAPLGPEVPFFVDNQVVSLAITAPSNGLRIRDSLLASASTSEPVSRVVFALGSSVVEDLAAPYAATLDTSGLQEGQHTLTATAYAITGEPTAASVTVFVDHTPPLDLDMARITADDQGSGLAQVAGLSGAAEGGASVEVRLIGSLTSVLVVAANDGSFATRVTASEGDFLELRALDSVGNASQWLPLEVTRSVNSDGIPLNGMALWVKADAGITTDESGLVTAWSDQSPHANHLVQTNTTRRPLLVAGGFNGYPVLRFDGNSDVLNFTNRLTTIRTVFFVLKEDDAATPNYRSLLGDGSTFDFHGGHGAPGPIWNPAAGSATVSKNGLTVLNGVPVDGTTTMRPRTMSVLSVTTSANGTANWFGSQNGSNYFWWGDLAEMIVYHRAVTDSERTQVETYLAQKYRPYVPATSTPRISPAGGFFHQSTTVTLAAQPGATIHYTVDGSEPSETSSTSLVYTGPFNVTATTTVKARAVKAGLEASSVATATFIEAATAPVQDGMALWVRADAGIPTDVTHPSVWADQSGRGNHLVQTDGTRLPRLVTDEGSGLPAMRFDGNSDFLRFTNRLTTIRTVFFVVKENDAATSSYRSLLGDGSTTDFHGGHGAPGPIWNPVAGSATVAKNGLTVLNGVPVDGATTMRPRTMSVLSVTTSANATANWFGSQNGSNYFWWGDLAELIIYERALSSSERTQVESYLKAKYAIGGKVTTPVVSPNGGPFSTEVLVSLSTATQGARIHYTLDGSEPTEASPLYSEPFPLNATTTVKARAFKDGLTESETATAAFTLDTDFTPRSLAGIQLWLRADAGAPSGAGDFWEDQSGLGNHGFQSASPSAPILIPNAVNGLPAMRFDGNSDFLRFTNRLTTIRTVFFVVKENDAATPIYRSLLGDGSTTDFHGGHGAPGPIWNPVAGSATVSKDGLTVLNGVPVNGTTTMRPRTMSVLSVTTSANATANWFGSQSGSNYFWWGDLAELIIYERALSSSERAQVESYLKAKYAIGGKVTTPVVSPNGGPFSTEVLVSLSTATQGARIHYTLDGSEPTEASPLYSEPFPINATTTVKARAFKEGLTESETATAAFTLDTDFTPRSLAGIQLWLRADAGAPSGAGDFWEDQSGLGNHGFQSASPSAPILVPNAVNGLPAMRFDGSSDFLRFTNRLTTIRTVFFVVKENDAATSNFRSLLGDGSTTDFHGGHGAPGPIWNPVAGSATVSKDGLTVLNGVPVNGTTTMRPRTMSVLSVTTSANATANWFGSQNGSNYFWWGDLAELIIYDRALSSSERQQIEAYLKAKYGTP